MKPDRASEILGMIVAVLGIITLLALFFLGAFVGLLLIARFVL